MMIKKKIFSLAILVSLSFVMLNSCMSSKDIMAQESLTGIYSIRKSGLFSSKYTFSSNTISKVKSSNTNKSELKHQGETLSTVNKAVSFEMEDERGFKWAGIGVLETSTITGKDKNKKMSNLEYKFRLTESITGRILKLEVEYNPSEADFNGFMNGLVVDADGNTVYSIYSSQNLSFYANPVEGINGFSIRRGDEVLAGIIKAKSDWSVTYNVPADSPDRVDLSPVLASLFVMIEEGDLD